MVQWIISSSVLIVTIICLRSLLRGKLRPGFCYALWLLAAVRLLFPFNIGNSVLSIQNVMNQAVLRMETEEKTEASPAGFAQDGVKVYGEIAEMQAEKTNEPALSEIQPSGNQGMNELESIRKTDVSLVFVRIWILGAMAFTILFLYSNLRFHKNLNRTRRLLKGQTEKLPVYCAENLKTPCLFGFFRPALYVTAAVAENPEILRHAVAHEMSHYEQGDSWWAFLRCICLVLHWYNPLVWWAAKLSKQDAELACDAATIKKLGEEERLAYGKTLIQLTCEKHQDLLVTATTMTSEKKSITERICRIAKKSRFKRYAVVIVVLAGGLAVAGTFTNGVAKKIGTVPDTVLEETSNEAFQEESTKIDESDSAAESNEAEKKENCDFADILDEYYEALVNVRDGIEEETELPYSIVNPYWAWEGYDTADILEKIVYAYQDLDGDGTEELLLGWAENEFWNLDEGYVFAVYTMKQGEPVLAVEGWERNIFVVGTDGYLYNRGSSSAWESSYTKYRFNPAYEDYLEPIEEIRSCWSEEKQDKEWVHLTDTEEILKVYEDGNINVTMDIIMDEELAYETGEQWMASGMTFSYESFADRK